MWQIFLLLWQNFDIFVAKFGISNGNFPRCQVTAVALNVGNVIVVVRAYVVVLVAVALFSFLF